jgi:trimethylamine---corrinoid protein Co-methyltransferase
LIHDVGYLESGLTYSFAQLVICAEMIRWLKYYSNEVEVNEETLAMDLIQEIGHSEQYIQLEHTYKHFRRHYYPDLFERGIYDTWMAEGSKTLAERACERVDAILAKHQPEPLPRDVKARIKEILDQGISKAKK